MPIKRPFLRPVGQGGGGGGGNTSHGTHVDTDNAQGVSEQAGNSPATAVSP